MEPQDLVNDIAEVGDSSLIWSSPSPRLELRPLASICDSSPVKNEVGFQTKDGLLNTADTEKSRGKEKGKLGRHVNLKLPPGKNWKSHSAPASPRVLADSVDPVWAASGILRPHRINRINHLNLPPLLPAPKLGIDGVRDTVQTPGGRRDIGRMKNGLEKLDLEVVQRSRDASEPNEQLWRDEIAISEKECSRVAHHVYLGSDVVARNREKLLENGITHVLNCVGFICEEYFPETFTYKTLWLQDNPCEDITCVLYDVFDYFEEVRESSGRVFVHCCKGISRSTSLVIAYLMWRDGRSFEDAFHDVKAARSITNPNIGFACQLLQAQKRVHATPASPNSLLRMYRMAPQSSYDPLHLVPKIVNGPGVAALDSRGAFVVHVPGGIFVWLGMHCKEDMTKAAKAAAYQVMRYERAQGPIFDVIEGTEPPTFWEAMNSSLCIVKDEQHNSSEESIGEKKVHSYDVDFELYEKAQEGKVRSLNQTSHRDSGWTRLREKIFSGLLREKILSNTTDKTLSQIEEAEVDSEHPITRDVSDFYSNIFESCSFHSAVSDLSSDLGVVSPCSHLSLSPGCSTPTLEVQQSFDGGGDDGNSNGSGGSLRDRLDQWLLDSANCSRRSSKTEIVSDDTSSADRGQNISQTEVGGPSIEPEYLKLAGIHIKSYFRKVAQYFGFELLDYHFGNYVSSTWHKFLPSSYVHEQRARLYVWPEMKEIMKFGLKDLTSGSILVLVGSTDHAFVWVGKDAKLEFENSLESCKEDMKISVNPKPVQVGSTFMEHKELGTCSQMMVVHQGQEPEEFWELFLNG